MKKVIIGLVVIMLVGFLGYNYVMAAPKNIKTSKADYNLTTKSLFDEITKNLGASEIKYTDKVVGIEGVITEVEENGVTIDNQVFCQLTDTENLKKGDKINVKGLFIGYDELFELIKLDQGSIVK